MHYEQFMQFVLYTCYKFRLLLESVLAWPEMGQIANNLKLLEAKNGFSSIPFGKSVLVPLQALLG